MTAANLSVGVQRLSHGRDLPLPEIQTAQSAGVDLLAAVEGQVTLQPGERMIVPTGLAIALPSGYEAQVRPRSGRAINQGVTLVNSPGTIDADYRGEIGAIVINHGSEEFVIERGMRIAQMVVAPVIGFSWKEMDELPQSERGEGGFGSTGNAQKE